MYEYAGEVMAVHDGDSVTLRIDLGLDTSRWLQETRLDGIDAPELSTAAGKVARDALFGLIMGKTLKVHTIKDRTEKYGRYLIVLFLEDGLTTANAWMVDHGYAVLYSGGKRTPPA